VAIKPKAALIISGHYRQMTTGVARRAPLARLRHGNLKLFKTGKNDPICIYSKLPKYLYKSIE
jgi:hypothetical protein